jgi:phosphate/sulfate permease
MSISLAIVLLLVLAAEFANGWTDAPNAIATVVSTRILSLYAAVVMAAFMNILGERLKPIETEDEFSKVCLKLNPEEQALFNCFIRTRSR